MTISEQAMSSNKWENPVGLDGIEFIEFTGPDILAIENLFSKMGFKKIGVHKVKRVQLWRQGDINFIINAEPDSFGENFKSSHGPSICAMAVRVKSAEQAMKTVLSRGARAFEGERHGTRGLAIPAIYGIGNSLVYLVDMYGSKSIYDFDFEYLDSKRDIAGLGFSRIDHLTNNVERGKMQEWCDFYSRIFNFKETRFFDIRGKKTGLYSKVMSSPCGKIIIPINEATDPKSQIQEYITEYKGEGIQHVALLTHDIVKSVASAREAGISFLETPDTYFDMIPERVPNVTENLGKLKELKILVDGDENGYLLQIFTNNVVGPIFFEVIQRKNNNGFGEGNFQALFDAIERDQMKRGVL